ncbi:UTRA domain-containing protein [Humitalea sp. 24SJ18S-53]|uniref:UTRA domain-containing protein n=1 Tax=Humitalea sp. 24SJ18S-53 TaxID=3422307 RepID=UPI003D67B1C3
MPADWAAQLPHWRMLHMVAAAGGVEAQRVQQTATALNANAASARLLNVKPGAALLVLQRCHFDRSDRIIQASRIVARPDRGQSIVELFRVRL